MRNSYALLFIVLLSCVQPAWGQNYGELNIGDVRSRFYANGRVAFDTLSYQPHFEVPQGVGANANFSGGMWIGGLTSGGQTRVSSIMYDTDGANFHPGPLRVSNGATDISDAMAYDQVWSVTREQIATHLSFFNCLADPDCSINDLFPNGYIIPPGIAEWPAMGDVAGGYDTYLAPFYDFNMDNEYDAHQGDAPCILGDQALFSVFNDYLGIYNGNQPMRLEVRQMPFAYSTGDPMLDQTVFVRYHVINRSSQTYTNTMLGFFNDFDLGCSNDDFIGSDPSRNLFYVYNWDDTDENCLGAVGYGEQPPAIGMVLLKGPLADANGADDPLDNALPAWNGFSFGDGAIDNERHGMSSFMYFNREGFSAITDPVTATHHYNYLNATWKDGTPLTYGGTGYSTAPDAVPARFMYPGADDPVGAGTNGQIMSPWLENSPTPATPDRRGIMSAGPVTLEPGEHIDLLYAYVYARAASGGAFASVAALQARVDSVRAFASTLPIWNNFETEWSGQCADYASLGLDDPSSAGELMLFPSPASTQVSFIAPPALIGGELRVRDALGRLVIAQRILPERNSIDIAALAKGVYACEAQAVHARFTGRIVKE